MKRNPKQDGSILFDCIPQKGPCPNQCAQCYYNRPGAFYLPIERRHFPTLEEVGDGIVRVNSGHDSNINKEHVISSTKKYPKRFFNTSIPKFNFPDPVVYTVNPREENQVLLPKDFIHVEYAIKRLMFVRIRVSSTNLGYVAQAAEEWGKVSVPVVLTFMRYYDNFERQHFEFYEKRKNIKNEYWCPTPIFIRATLAFVRQFNSETKICGTPESSYCRDCMNCANFYYEAKERMKNATTTTR